MSDKRVLVVGDVFDGYRFHGPFPDFDSADDASHRIEPNRDSWISVLVNPRPHDMSLSAEDVEGQLGCMIGDQSTGFVLYGPFSDRERADLFGRENEGELKGWSVFPINPVLTAKPGLGHAQIHGR